MPCYGSSQDGLCDVDFGCDRKNQFSSIKLTHILTQIANYSDQNLNKLRNVLVFSDDAKGVQHEMDILRSSAPEWNLFFYNTPNYLRELSNNMTSQKRRSLIYSEEDVNTDIEEEEDEDWEIDGNDWSYFGRQLNDIKGTTYGISEGSYWWSSLYLASQCEGFAGHMASAASMMMSDAICHIDHPLKKSVCPVKVDMQASKLIDYEEWIKSKN